MKDDEFFGKYCDNCHTATGLCDCKDCDECGNVEEPEGINIDHELAGGLTDPSY